MFAPSMQLYYQLEVHNIRTSKLVRRTRKYRAHSFLVAYIQHLRGFWNNAIESNLIDTGSASGNIDIPGNVPLFAVAAAVGVTNNGLRVGTGTTAVAMTDDSVETPVAEGTGSGQLTHGATTISTHAGGAAEASFTAVRTFSNSSGGTITVTETAVYCASDNSGGTAKFFALVRDVLSSSVAVGDGQVLTVTYTVKVTT
ncbi:hypothetical protein LCGC14_0364170 [marine sediment metagenome]|uniref:Uncharacterized protein n=1 Tax=marine sediment metagenome TaxID=412755 RepID=A0A0F9WFL6_9ZZZZ